MPPSQLKKLKASLHEKGLISQQRSKKKQRQANKNGNLNQNGTGKLAALQLLREQFNPFEAKPVKKDKYALANGTHANGSSAKPEVARPGVTKGLGEEKVGRFTRILHQDGISLLV